MTMSIPTKNQKSKDSDQTQQRRKASMDLVLHKASKEGNLESVETLLKKGEDVNCKDNFGNTPLHLACFHGQLECIERLIEHPQIDLNCKDLYQRTPLFYCARNGYDYIVDKLIKKGVDINIKTDTGETALMKAAYYGHANCLRLLIASAQSKKISLEEQDRTYGNTALHFASSKGHLDCVKCLIESSVDLNIKNTNGYTSLHLAVTYRQSDVIKALIASGANLETKNNNHKTPYDDSVSLGYKDIQSLLKKAIIAHQLEELKRKDPLRWSCHDVAKYLNLIGFGQYKDPFIQNDITGRSLKSLSLQSLKIELNVQSLGHRTSILEHIKKLFKERKPEDSPNKLSSSIEIIVTGNGQDIEIKDARFPEAKLWEIPRSELQMCELLGKGFFGEVRRSIWNGTEVAVKEIYKSSFGKQSDLDVFYKELNILSKLRHPSVIQFLGACTLGTNKCIITEFLRGGNLHTLIHQNWNVLERNQSLRYRIICDVIKGMTYLHDFHILHRDLTTKNLLLDSNFNCKISDFGLSRIKEESREMTMTSGLGCLPYQAPEVFRGERYAEPADVYSFGMVVYELVSGFEPHQGFEPLKFVNMVAYENYRPPLPKNCSVQWERVITLCWNKDINMRPTFKKLLTELQIIEPVSKFDVAVAKSQAAAFDNAVGAYTE